MKNNRLIIGSRSSPLAMAQAGYVKDRLQKSYPSLDIEIKTIKTVGDKIPDAALSKIGGKGLFTKEIDEALLGCRIDIAVHSMKDVPTELPSGIIIAAVTGREDPRDVIVSKEGFTIQTLRKGSRVGTSSLRRRAQLLYIRKDLDAVDLRGNLETRIKKMEQGLYDAIILAYAGIKRLGYTVKLSAVSMEDMLPQAGQGALCIETLGDNEKLKDMIKVLDDSDSHSAIDAERALLSELEGGCQTPIGVYAEVEPRGAKPRTVPPTGGTGARVDGSMIRVNAGVFSLDGRSAVKDEISGNKNAAETLGRELAGKILKNAAARQILSDIRKEIR